MEKLRFAAIDVDDKAFHVSVVDENGKDISTFSSKPNHAALVKKLALLGSSKSLKVCYEASYIGFSLQRQLKKAGFSCEIVAPSLIPYMPGKKVKTDRLDCIKLARYYAQGLLTKIHILQEEDECDRDLVRSRGFIAQQLKRTKNHIIAYCKRQGWNFREETGLVSYWTRSHLVWLERQVSASSFDSLRKSMGLMLREIGHLENTLKMFDEEIERLSDLPKYASKTKALKIFRGLDTHSALTLVTELGDIKRFDHPSQLTAYAGLDIKEYSSGGKERKLGISKMGNPYIRTTVVEACQFALRPPRVSRVLALRRLGIDQNLIDIADRCMTRLHKKSTKLLYRDKPRNKIKTACAREMLGFIWEALRKVS